MGSTASGNQQSLGPSSDLAELWREAIVEYEKMTGTKIDSMGGANNTSQLLSEVEGMKSRFAFRRHDGSRLDKMRTLVKKIVGPVETLANVIASATKIAYPPAEAIVGAVRILIVAGKTVSARYDTVIKDIERIAFFLESLSVLENGISPVPELKVVLVKIFISVLQLCGICTKHMKKNRLAHAFRSLSPEDDEERRDVEEQLATLIDLQRSIVANATFITGEQTKEAVGTLGIEMRDGLSVTRNVEHNTKATQDDVAKLHKLAKDHETDNERDKILTCLSCLQFDEKQRMTFAKYHQGTCHWFLDRPDFQQWFLGERNSTLWCPGIPGAGKSVLFSLVVDYALQHALSAKCAVAYVYCDYKDKDTYDDRDYIRSITRQLVEQCKAIPVQVKDFWAKHTESRRSPTIDERLALLRTVSGLFKRTYVFIDALDECAENTRARFIRIAHAMEPFVRLFVTSRDHLSLGSRFTNLSRINIEARECDVRRYVSSEIETNERLSDLTAEDPDLKLEIIEALTSKAGGMFLLSHLQLIRLSGQSSRSGVRRFLNSMPTGVHDLYKDALKRIEDQSPEDRDIAVRALSYVSHAKRSLTAEELCHMLSVEVGTTELDKDKLPVIKILSSICAGLLRIDGKNGPTSLVHYSLQEFISKGSGKLLPEPEKTIATACLTYLSFDVFGTGPCIDGEALEQRFRQYQLLEYASHHWGHHLAEVEGQERLDLVMAFLGDTPKMSSYIQALHVPRSRTRRWHDRFPREVTPLHIAAYWGLIGILKELSPGSGVINSPDSNGMAPIHLSAQNGHSAAVELLIDYGADVNLKNYRGETALLWAARNGHDGAVKLIISKGGDTAVQDTGSCTALGWAVIGGHIEVVGSLLHVGFDTDLERNDRNQALILAAEAGRTTIVELLLKHGAQINFKDNQGSSALDWAVPEGHMHTVSSLLENGADVNSTDIYFNTPLHWAISHPPITRLLIAHGANVDAQNDCRQTPLTWSAQDGQEENLRELVRKSASVNAQDIFGFTALHVVALKGYEAIASFLLENGADADVLDNDGWTPLHAAALRQHDGIVRLLLDKTRDRKSILDLIALQRSDAKLMASFEHTAARKSNGSSALTGLRWAASEGRVERVQTILDNGADIDAEDVGGWTALTIAAWMGQESTIQLLLENGAAVDKTERYGKSALHVAAKEGFWTIVRLLIEHGAHVNARVWSLTPLLFAAQKGHSTIVHDLLHANADVHAEDYRGRRALHWIAKGGTSSTLQMLWEKGADVDVADQWGRTPLMWAIENGRTENMVMLLKAGAKLELEASDSSTALHIAAYIGSEDMVGELLRKGSNVNAKTQDGFTPLHIAAFMGAEEVVSMLLENGASLGVQAPLPGSSKDFQVGETNKDPEGECGSGKEDWESGSDDGGWVDMEDGVSDIVSDSCSYDTDFGKNEVQRISPSLVERLRQLLFERGLVKDLKETTGNGLTVQKLAARCRNVAIQSLADASKC